jgi:hypothetical protein
MLLVDHFRGLVEADVSLDWVASAIGSHHNAIRQALETGDRAPLKPFDGRWYPVDDFDLIPEINLRRLVQLGLSGDLGYDDIYILE